MPSPCNVLPPQQLFCLLVFAAAVFFPPPAGAEVETTVRGDATREITTRIFTDIGALRAVAVEHRDERGEAQHSFGLEAGPVMFGPTERKGLHRIVHTPLGFAAGSDVWNERTNVGLDIAMEPTSRYGGQLELVKERLFVSAYEGAGVRSFGANAAHTGHRVELRGLSLVSAVHSAQAADAGERWYPRETPFAGGLLSNTAVQAVLRPTEVFAIHATGLLSTGQYVPPAGAALVLARYSGQLLTGAVALGTEQPRYRAPDGESPSAFRAADGSAALSLSPLDISGKARALVEDRPLSREAVHPWEYGGELRVEAGRSRGLRGGVSLERSRHSSAQEEVHHEGAAEVLLSVRGAHVFAKLEARRRWRETYYEDAVRLQTSLRGAGLNFEQWVRVDWPDGLALEAEEDGRGGTANGGRKWIPDIAHQGAPPELAGRVALGWRPGRVSVAVHAETMRAVELTLDGREAASSDWPEYVGFGLEVSLRIDTPTLDAEDESGYLEIYGKPDHVDDGRHERSGHDRGVEAQSMDE